MQTNKSKKGIYITIVCVLVLIVGLWIWKDTQLRSLKGDNDKQIIEMEKQYTQQMLNVQSENLRSIIKPLVWAVRAEMLKNNWDDINIFINELVKDKGFQFIFVADDKNRIISSTNKKWEGKTWEDSGIPLDLVGDSTMIKTVDNNNFFASAPVMGLNKRMGSVVISFSSTTPDFK